MGKVVGQHPCWRFNSIVNWLIKLTQVDNLLATLTGVAQGTILQQNAAPDVMAAGLDACDMIQTIIQAYQGNTKSVRSLQYLAGIAGCNHPPPPQEFSAGNEEPGEIESTNFDMPVV